MEDIFIGRQPIFDAKLNVFAYELLFRSGEGNDANVTDGDSATSDVILKALTEIGMEKLVGNHKAFINLTHNHIINMSELPLPEMKDRLVLEILEDVKAEDDIISAVTSLANDDYTIALDDFIYHESLQPLVDIADIIKIDLMAISKDELEQHVKLLSNGKRKLLAEKVETQEEFEHCKELGFDYFQGYFFSKPNIVIGKKLPSNKMAVIQLLAKLQDPDISDQELASTITQDVSMSLRVLRYINSAQFGITKKIDSIKQAIMMLGRTTIRNLANLVALSHVQDKPHELFIISMVRAKMAENIAALTNIDKEVCFTIGLFSNLDTLMDQKIDVLIETLPLSENIKLALQKHEGIFGNILKCIIAYENCEWDDASYGSLDTNDIRTCYLDALDWAATNSSLLQES